ncbi:Cobalt-zinc-cadmium resistance protein CzcC [compost metagenome]
MIAFPCPRALRATASAALCLALAPLAVAQQQAGSVSAPASLASAQTSLTLQAAQARALSANPSLLAAEKDRLAWDGTVRQAGAFANPELSLEGDELRSDSRTEAIRLIQPLDISGKRRARTAVAEAGRDRTDATLAARRIELRTAVASAFVGLQEAEALERLAQQKVDVFSDFRSAVARRVEAGKVSPIEREKVGSEASLALIESQDAAQRTALARRRLAGLWGRAEAPDFSQLSGPFGEPTALPDRQAVLQGLPQRPEYLARQQAIREQQARLEFERARRFGDITLAAGVKRIHQPPSTGQSAQNTLMVSVGIPLPLLDRNQGNIYEATQQIDRARLEADATRNQLQLRALELLDGATLAAQELQSLREQVLPASRETVRAVTKGYELGKFSYLDALDAQRNYFRNEALYIAAAARYERLKNEILELAATPARYQLDAQ